jgi:hypothetical protein
MKKKALIIGVLLAVLSIGMITDADAHRRGRYYRGGYGYRPAPGWVAPPPVVVITSGYGGGYRQRPYYGRPRYNRGYGYGYNRGYNRGYGYRGGGYGYCR